MNKIFGNKRNPCAEFRERIDDFLVGNLPEKIYLELESHRLECRECRKALEEEQKVAALMADIEKVRVPGDFRDRVMRAWRTRNENVSAQLPQSVLNRLTVILGITAMVLVFLPMVRLSMYSAAERLAGAFERIPAQYRGGMEITFQFPSMAEVGAFLQVSQGVLFEKLGQLGTAVAPWTGWLWAVLLLSLVIGVAAVWKIGKPDDSHERDEKEKVRV